MMTLRRSLAAYLGAALVLGIMDAGWLTVASNLLYKPAIGDLLAPAPHPLPAALFYLIYLIGLVIFGVAPAIRSGRWRDAPLKGALFGLFCYATYDLTNQATLRNWSPLITIADLSWGTLVTGTASAIGYSIAEAVA